MSRPPRPGRASSLRGGARRDTGSQPSFVCPRCNRESFNGNDIKYRYCGYCHASTECSIPGCAKVRRALGLCNMHYERQRRHGDVGPPEPLRYGGYEFWEMVDAANEFGCRLWLGNLDDNGYGLAGSAGRAHRVAYELTHGPIPEGFHVDHTCHSSGDCMEAGPECPHRRCCEPTHLEALSPTDHQARMRLGNAVKTHCPVGHPLSGPNLILSHRSDGSPFRQCRECHSEAARRYRARISRSTDIDSP